MNPATDRRALVRRLAGRLGPLVRRERGVLAGAFAALGLEVALRALEPWPLKYVFDRVLLEPAADGAPWRLLGAASALVALVGLRATAAYWNTLGFSLAGNRVLARVRDELYQHLQRLSVVFHARARTGDLVTRLSRDVDLLKEVTVTAALPLAANLLILLAMAGLMLWLDWALALLALGTLPFFWLAAARLAPRIHRAARRQRAREGAVASAAAEAMGAIRVVQALALEGTLAGRFARDNQAGLGDDVSSRRLAARLERTVDVLVAVATALVLGTGAALALRGRLTPGELLVFLSYLKSAFKPMQDVAKYTGRLARAWAAAERVAEVLDREPDVADRADAVPAPPFRGAIAFEAVRFGYESGRPVLDGLTLAIPAGSRVAIMGPSGAGKTTLAGLLLRFFDPEQGRILIDGRDIRDYTLASLRRQIAVVPQEAMLFAATVRDNIALGVPAATAREIEAAARLANAHEFIQALPAGYDTVVGERGATLSNGQRQRIAIARAALRRTPILILDEPTTGLDRENARAVSEALIRLSAGATMLVITHDPELAALADRVVWLDGGRLGERNRALAG
ncbi:MAG TPA: ABC transporter ATP-binding protein [Gemmatimonadales bacterium]|jgi:ATP-binding cassette subfamily B protein|nr:ABC transporter ATP-binding protein [Gemmatimonadales bacterium]